MAGKLKLTDLQQANEPLAPGIYELRSAHQAENMAEDEVCFRVNGFAVLARRVETVYAQEACLKGEGAVELGRRPSEITADFGQTIHSGVADAYAKTPTTTGRVSGGVQQSSNESKAQVSGRTYSELEALYEAQSYELRCLFNNAQKMRRELDDAQKALSEMTKANAHNRAQATKNYAAKMSLQDDLLALQKKYEF